MNPLRVTVVYGGTAAEAAVSVKSGQAYADLARKLGHNVTELNIAVPNWLDLLKESRPEVVLNGLHGKFGEDGGIQAVLEMLKIPYTHSGVLASALSMDKDKSKIIMAAAGVPVPQGLLANRHTVAKQHVAQLPYVVKPNAEGSSIGVFIVHEGDEPPTAVGADDWTYGEDVLVEEFIAGREFTVGVLNDEALGITEILPNDGKFYDFDEKYKAGGAKHMLNPELPAGMAEKFKKAAVAAHQALDCKTMSRTDFRYDEATDKWAALELNIQPGFTPQSLWPEQFVAAGYSLEDSVKHLIVGALNQ